MYVIVNSLRYRLIAAVVSLAIFGVIYFAVIKPNHDAANNAVTQSEKQLQQVLQNVNKQSGVTVPSSAVNLSACLTAAGTDASKIQACEAASR
jgi:hypothetical protein